MNEEMLRAMIREAVARRLGQDAGACRDGVRRCAVRRHIRATTATRCRRRAGPA